MKCEQETGIYDIHQSYLQNAEEGPYFSDSIIPREFPPQSEWIDFLGYKVASRIGVPAGPLLNSKWIKLAADLHYDIVCYKTIRTQEYLGHSVPNVIFVNGNKQLSPNDKVVEQRKQPPDIMSQLGITNSFGMPSRSREYLLKDIPQANQYLNDGQIMVVSVVGSPAPDGSSDAYIQDFIDAALLAKECGAKIIEANYSCPNVGAKGILYLDPDMIFRITKQIVSAIDPTPLMIKVGSFPDSELMRSALRAAESAGARAVSGINSLSLSVINSSGAPALGVDRPTSGVCGAPIKNAALTFIRDCRRVIKEDRLDLLLVGCGGITEPDHFNEFFTSGADIAMTATGMMWDPYLAIKYTKPLRVS